jgi:hypothetical protein
MTRPMREESGSESSKQRICHGTWARIRKIYKRLSMVITEAVTKNETSCSLKISCCTWYLGTIQG